MTMRSAWPYYHLRKPGKRADRVYHHNPSSMRSGYVSLVKQQEGFHGVAQLSGVRRARGRLRKNK